MLDGFANGFFGAMGAAGFVAVFVSLLRIFLWVGDLLRLNQATSNIADEKPRCMTQQEANAESIRLMIERNAITAEMNERLSCIEGELKRGNDLWKSCGVTPDVNGCSRPCSSPCGVGSTESTSQIEMTR